MTVTEPEPQNSPLAPEVPLQLGELEDLDTRALRKLADRYGVEGTADLTRDDLIYGVLQAQAEHTGLIYGQGVLEILSDGWGFLRHDNFEPAPDDIYVSQSQIRRFGLRTGDWVSGEVRHPKETEKYFSLLKVEAVNQLEPELARRRREYADLTTVYPSERMRIETHGERITGRFIDLIAPVGKGQRGLIVSPPKAGKTTILKDIANGITSNNPEVFLIVLLVDERPEEVTDIRRSVRGQVVSSTFDSVPDNHLRVSEMVLEESKRLVESGRDVVILLDSLTRLARASNLSCNPSGRTLSGGLDPAALYRPKRFFGAARNIEEGGSLTIIATALVDTGSRMDDMIFEEFKGTGNWELHLDRQLQERRIFPAIDIKRSGTRHDELLFTEGELKQVWKLHRALAALDNVQAAELLIDRLRSSTSNDDFLALVDKQLKSDRD